MPACDSFRALCIKISEGRKVTIIGSTNVIKETPSLVENTLIKHAFDTGRESVDFEQLDHKSV